jgi:hypothetical protein
MPEPVLERAMAQPVGLYPAGVGSEIVAPLGSSPRAGSWNGAGKFLDQEVMHADLLGVALRTPFPSVVFEVANQFFFLVSTEITGWSSAKAVLTAALMKVN